MNIEKEDIWIHFCNSSWDAAGRPSGLNPHTVLKNPIEYDRYYYDYFESRYIDMWLAIYSRINPVNGFLLKNESAAFRGWWHRNFCWETIWKQTLPLLVYGTALGVRNAVLVELASLYSLGQAIPSVVIDRVLDDDTKDETFNSDPAFCVLSYTKALSRLRAMKLPSGAIIEDTFVNLTSEMYDKMLVEHARRFEPIPTFVSDAIRNYLLPSSRLSSSVFFGILPVWAHSLANKIPSEHMMASTMALRMVRQLNDEILDVYDDISRGLLTLPWLYALEEKPELREVINALWKDRTNPKVFSTCQQILRESSGQKRASSVSLEMLSQSMNTTIEYFPVYTVFEITMLHNIRWALLNWLEKTNYERGSSTIHAPCLPQDKILDVTNPNPIEPVPGGGVVVFDAADRVLMTLVLKRGMLRWELPAGTAKSGETLEETAQREALEETGKKIEIGKVVAMCWHYSRRLNKGWMGVIFQGELINENLADDFLIVNPQAFAHSKFNIYNNPDLYHSIDFANYNFEELLRLCKFNSRPTAHESVIAAGFIDWKRIPDGRIHPLHRKLLQTHRNDDQYMKLLFSDADEDIESYDEESRLYYKN